MAHNMNVTSQQFMQRWQTRMQDPQTIAKIRAGVTAVTQSPGIAAADAREYMVTRWNQVTRAGGTWEANMRALPVQYWKDQMLGKGLNQLPGGVNGAGNKVQSFADALLAFERQLQTAINSMPKATLGDRKARMDHWFDQMSQVRYSRAQRQMVPAGQ